MRQASSYFLTGFRVILHTWLSLLLNAGCSVGSHGFLRWRCKRSMWRLSWGTCRWTRDNEGYVVRCAAIDLPAIFDLMWFLTTRPLVIIPMNFAEFSEWENCRYIVREARLSRINQFSDINCCLFFAVTTVVGLSEILTVSNSAALRSFLLTIWMLAPESTTSPFPPALLWMRPAKPLTSEGE